MCGRYAASKDQAELVEEFDVELVAPEPGRSLLATPQQPPAGMPDFNVAPTKQAPVVLTRAPEVNRPPIPCGNCGCSRGVWCRRGRKTRGARLG